ncbi:MAG: Uma2 family endonuclease [candidate division KSB1 bacterium]|nr:Uma2 family endonuclease [candidate division KSB1 bacterium]MDZ7365232.1 Uma2 family endonuclease [candidate division KSB1 bacterium]MDZ7403099.1 Uma2 family endonuclease [candidate division KSB1 bacterium]
MAEIADINIVAAPPKKTTTPATRQIIPIEQRTDVTVDELERTSLLYPAELYDGKVVYKMANPAHGIVQGKITTELNLYLRQNRIGYVMPETNFRLWPNRSDQSRIPDVSFLKKDRMPDDLYHFPAMAPDLAIEIISPEDNFMTVMNKVDAYLEQGAQVVWLIITVTREVLVCTATSKHSVRDVLTAPDLLPGFELPVGKIFEGIPLPPRS